eukprot:1150565-Pelagomonas_calceolata.AAC.16
MSLASVAGPSNNQFGRQSLQSSSVYMCVHGSCKHEMETSDLFQLVQKQCFRRPARLRVKIAPPCVLGAWVRSIDH